MSNAKHTPGPWEVVAAGGGKPKATFNQPKTIYSENGLAIATIAGARGGPHEWLANARLISAAPELLKALKDLLAWPALINCADTKVAAAKAAIAKAEPAEG